MTWATLPIYDRDVNWTGEAELHERPSRLVCNPVGEHRAVMQRVCAVYDVVCETLHFPDLDRWLEARNC
jgi:hypothetical protein